MHCLEQSQESPNVWGAKGDLQVWLEPLSGCETVMLHAPNHAVFRVLLRWETQWEAGVRWYGDHFERGYGDLEWRGLVPERRLFWYALGHSAWTGTTLGLGVCTGSGTGAFAHFQIDSAGLNLWLDVACGGRGVQLGDRTLKLALLFRAYYGRHNLRPDFAAFEAARQFCRTLCPQPRLPSEPVYGANDWYYAYGNSSQEQILRDTSLLVELAPDSPNHPFMVIDDGWQAGRGRSSWGETQVGPWNAGNERFPDMPGLAQTMKGLGVKPGIWIRPLGAAPGTPASRLLPESRTNGATGGVPALDPTIPENRAQIVQDMRTLRQWGFDLIKHDWTTCDLLGRWGFQMADGYTNPGWSFADRTRTTAEVVSDLYAALREGAGEALLIGCNTIGHLGAGVFEIQRTGDDTSGREWERTRKMGVNTLAFRMPQHDTFFAADADCVGLTKQIPWHLNRQWLDLLSRSGTPLFVSADPDAVGPEQRAALREAYARASKPHPPAEPLDWLDTTCPAQWKFGDEKVTYRWSE